MEAKRNGTMAAREWLAPVLDDIVENDEPRCERLHSEDVMNALKEQKMMLTKILNRLDEGLKNDSSYTMEQTFRSNPRLPNLRSPKSGVPHIHTKSSDESNGHSNLKRNSIASKLGKSLRTQMGNPTHGEGEKCSWLRGLVDRPGFDLFFGFLIFLNSMTLIVEEQYTGAEVGHELGFYSHYGSPEWKSTYFNKDYFNAVEALFALAFTVEVILRIFGERCEYFQRPSEYFDVAVVVLSDISVISSGGISVGVRVQVLRLLRAAKLMRLVRLIRTVEGFDALSLMVTALFGSAWALCWSMVMLSLIVTLCACLVTTFFREVYFRSDDSGLSTESEDELYMYFGTFVRSLLSLFELALANWPPICRFLVEDLHETYMIYVLLYKLVMGFAVIGVINAVFMQETFKVANTDDGIMLRTKTRAANLHRSKMKELFALVDKDGGGRISEDEFKEALEDPAIKLWLSSMELDATDADALFKMMSAEDGQIDLDHLISGINRFKGPARAIDVHTLMLKIDALQERSRRRPSLPEPSMCAP